MNWSCVVQKRATTTTTRCTVRLVLDLIWIHYLQNSIHKFTGFSLWSMVYYNVKCRGIRAIRRNSVMMVALCVLCMMIMKWYIRGVSYSSNTTFVINLLNRSCDSTCLIDSGFWFHSLGLTVAKPLLHACGLVWGSFNRFPTVLLVGIWCISWTYSNISMHSGNCAWHSIHVDIAADTSCELVSTSLNI